MGGLCWIAVEDMQNEEDINLKCADCRGIDVPGSFATLLSMYIAAVHSGTLEESDWKSSTSASMRKRWHCFQTIR